MDLGLSGKVVIVTGASQGLGAASARLLRREGAKLLLVARTEADLRSVASEIDPDGSETGICALDLTLPDGADRVVDATMQRYGRIDALVNCAGGSRGGVFWEIPDTFWLEAFQLKFFGTVRMIRAVLPIMREQQYGRVVTVAGNLGLQPDKRLLPSSTVNAALMALAKGLAEEVATDNVIVNTVNPGPTRTERWTRLMTDLASARDTTVDAVESEFLRDIPMNRLAEPEEIARHIVYLASDAASHLTGATLDPDGGWTRGV